jgi:cytoskeletal protein CcmA (bactofilin family)
MAFFGNNMKEGNASAGLSSIPETPAASAYNAPTGIQNVIGKGTVITGDIETSGDIRIDGKLEGNLFCKARVVLGQGAVLEGNLHAAHAELAGEVSGKVEVKEMLTLKNSASIHGDINTGKLIIEAGAKFNGSCKMGAVSKEVSLNSTAGLAQVSAN